MPDANVVIIGGGVSGLSAGYFLSQLGIRSTLIEKSPRLGGLIKTDVIEKCLLEAGPDSFIAAKPAVTELAQELIDLRDQIIGSNDERRRIFVVRGGKLVAMPRGMVMMAPGQWMPTLRSPLFSIQTKLRFFTETFSKPVERLNDVSVAEFVRDHFGNEVLQYVAEPLLSGVYGGDSAHLSAQSVLPRFIEYERKYGSLIRGVRHQIQRTPPHSSIFLSFRDGMQTLTDTLAHAAAPHMQVIHAEASRVERSATGWLIDAGDQRVEADRLILACPAYACARLLEHTAPSLATELGAIRYSSAILVNLVYERSRLEHPLNGFGFLVPRGERRTVAAATWSSTKFSNRVPPRLAALRAFIVEPEATELLKAPKETLVGAVRTEFATIMGIDASPLLSTVQPWPQSMPQYDVGHQQRCERIFQLTAECPDLHLTGNAYQGVGIPDCIRMAKETAKEVARGIGAEQFS
ncbi:MAG: protoporphyrinogen oxidase [Bryobacteraceae bacterium]